jgi:hypothetical protein
MRGSASSPEFRRRHRLLMRSSGAAAARSRLLASLGISPPASRETPGARTVGCARPMATRKNVSPRKRGSRPRPAVPFGRRIAHRRYTWRPPVGRSRAVDVEIGTPVRSWRSWACRIRISGLPKTYDGPIYGIDAVQALELALIAAGKFISESPQFRAGQIEQFGGLVTEPAALSLPLPMKTLQVTLENLLAYLDRLRTRGPANEEWRRVLLSMMREVAGDLATLAAHLPIRRARRQSERTN